MTILVIVESPAKISKISDFLGANYKVAASMGHIRNLDEKTMSIDFENNFNPIYKITKPDVVANLKKLMAKCDSLYIASDLDLEGSAIGQSLLDVLKPKSYKRLIFNAITKSAIISAIKTAGDLNINEVNAQKARRVIDRLFGYSVSDLLQKKIGGRLSAGRVQSVATEIIVDKEAEIEAFIKNNGDHSTYRVNGIFSGLKANLIQTVKFPSMSEAFNGKQAQIPITETDPEALIREFLTNCLKSKFTVHDIFDKKSTRSPSAPFTTSTLQQEANRKFGMSPDSTMKTAQKLYEGGFITYMRTDCVHISDEAHADIKAVILDLYGKKYYNKTEYKSKNASAQNAHEAIRPVHPDLTELEGKVDDPFQIKLYNLIWRRTIASQMTPAEIAIKHIQIAISRFVSKKIEPFYYFESLIEKIIFDGFMKVYTESSDNIEEETEINTNTTVPKINDNLTMDLIQAKQNFDKPPVRYTEASIVKKLEQIGIGRPSTYVNTIHTIIDRSYVEITDVAGVKKKISTFKITSLSGKITKATDDIIICAEKKKIVPTNLGKTVTAFLMEHFPELMDYKFTAKMEADLDKISDGTKVWHVVVKNFYDKLKSIIDKIAVAKLDNRVQKLLGTDADGNEIFATNTKYGPVVKKIINEKPLYANIDKPLTIDSITLKEAVNLLQYPKTIGQYKKSDIVLAKGKHGFYAIFKSKNYSLESANLKLSDIIKIIEEKEASLGAKFKINFKGKKTEAIIINGKFGPYISIQTGKKNINIPVPKTLDLTKITSTEIEEFVTKWKPYVKTKPVTKKKITKKVTK